MAKITLEYAFNKSQIIKESFPDSRKMAAFYVTIHIFEMFFKDSKFRMWIRYIDWVERMADGFQLLPMHTKVSFKYYQGLLQMFQYEYLDSYKNLMFWVEHASKDDYEFQSKLQKFLVPLWILFGDYPSKDLLEEHKLTQYEDLTAACQNGDLALFEKTISENQENFLQANTYLMIEKLRNVVIRNIFKRICESQEMHHVDFKVLLEMYNKELEQVQKLGLGDFYEEVNIWDLEAILASLIHKGFIRGYISHENENIVMAKKDAFPELKTVIENNKSKI